MSDSAQRTVGRESVRPHLVPFAISLRSSFARSTARPHGSFSGAAWTEHCRRHYRRWGMSITGFVLDGSAGASTDHEWAAYQRFSPDGLGTHFEAGPALHLGVPACPERDLPDTIAEAAAQIARDAIGSDQRPIFQWRRSALLSTRRTPDRSPNTGRFRAGRGSPARSPLDCRSPAPTDASCLSSPCPLSPSES